MKMAWFSGVYSCGHHGRTQIYGPIKQREWKAERHFSGLCSECWEKERQRKWQEELKMAETKSAELPQLQGTPKQVAWANKLRLEFIDKINEFFSLEHRKENFFKHHGVSVEEVLEHIIDTHTDATWFIDQRDRSSVSVLREEVDCMKEE